MRFERDCVPYSAGYFFIFLKEFFSDFIHLDTTGRRAGRQAGRQASRQASKQASEQASKPGAPKNHLTTKMVDAFALA